MQKNHIFLCKIGFLILVKHDQNGVEFLDILDFGTRFVPRGQRKMLAWKTHSYRHNLLAQFNGMECFSVPEFGNVKRKSVSESIHC